MLPKILALTLAVCTVTLFMSADALAWGGGSWNRSGAAYYAARYGNIYSRSYSGSLIHGGCFGGGGRVLIALLRTLSDCDHLELVCGFDGRGQQEYDLIFAGGPGRLDNHGHLLGRREAFRRGTVLHEPVAHVLGIANPQW